MDNYKKTNEIDLLAIGKKLIQNRKTLYISAGIGAVIGLIVAFSTPKTYTASVVLAPETSSSGGGLTGGIAGMASAMGIDLNGNTSSDAIYPEIYPDVIASHDFVLSLFDVPVRLQTDNTTRTYIKHLAADTKIPFWNYPKMWLSKLMKSPEALPSNSDSTFVDPFRISRKDAEICESVSDMIGCFVDKNTGEISITVTDQDPMVAAIMVDSVQRRLQSYITSYRTQKARIDYEYYEKMAGQIREELAQAQIEYAMYSDSHRGNVLTSVSTKMGTLESRMSDIANAYSGILKLRDQARAQIQEKTPAFTVIQSSKMPHKPSSRPKIITLLCYVFIAVLIGSVKILVFKK